MLNFIKNYKGYKMKNIIKLYHAPNTRGNMVLWALEESGLDYQLKILNLDAKEHKQATYLQINPFGRVPAMQINGENIIESVGMLMTIGDIAKNPLAPKIHDAHRPSYNRWMFFRETVFAPTLGAVMEKKEASYKFNEVLDYIEAPLKNHQNIVSDDFTMADIALIGGLGWAKSMGLIPDNYGHILAYIKSGLSRNAAKKMMQINADYQASLTK